jgi:hypothetical protein
MNTRPAHGGKKKKLQVKRRKGKRKEKKGKEKKNIRKMNYLFFGNYD